MPDNEAGAHIAPHLAGEGGGTDKETLRSNRTGMGPAREESPGDERSRVGRGGEYVTGQFAGGGCGVVECRSTAG